MPSGASSKMISREDARRLTEAFDAQRPQKAIEIGRLLAAYPSFRSEDAGETVAAYLDVLEPLTMRELQRGISRAMRDQPDSAFVPSAAFVLRSALAVDEADAGYHPAVEAHVRARDATRGRWQDLEDRRANLADLRILADGGRPQDALESLTHKLAGSMSMRDEATAVEKHDRLRADQARLGLERD